MVNTPWKTDNWFVSQWNYLPEVTEGFTPPKQLKIHDVTLRDGGTASRDCFHHR